LTIIRVLSSANRVWSTLEIPTYRRRVRIRRALSRFSNDYEQSFLLTAPENEHRRHREHCREMFAFPVLVGVLSLTAFSKVSSAVDRFAYKTGDR